MTLLAGLPERSPLIQKKISDIKEEWKKKINYPEDMDTA